MGLFDLFGSRETREQNQLRKLAQKITQKYGPPENRQKVIEQLGEMGTPRALRVLCQRFTTRVDVGIQDDEEKERAREILAGAGTAAIEPVKAFLREQESGVAWGLRVLAGLVSPEEAVATAAGAAPTREAAFLPLLEDLGDEGRIAATRVPARAPLAEAAREALIEL